MCCRRRPYHHRRHRRRRRRDLRPRRNCEHYLGDYDGGDGSFTHLRCCLAVCKPLAVAVRTIARAK